MSETTSAAAVNGRCHKINLDDDEGWFSLSYRGEVKTFDLYEVHARLFALHERCKGQEDTSAWLRGVADYLQEQGVGPVSLLVADQFAAGVFRRMQELRGDRPAEGKPPEQAPEQAPAS